MKILALSNPRNGTNYILESISQIYDTKYLGEFFHPDLKPNSVQYDRDTKQILNCNFDKGSNNTYQLYDLINNNLDIVNNTTTDFTVKLFIKHLKNIPFRAFYDLFSNEKFKKILIYRSDIEDSIYSYYIARKYKKWSVYKKEELDYLEDIVIDCKDPDFLLVYKKTFINSYLLKNISRLFNWDYIVDYSKLTGNPNLDFDSIRGNKYLSAPTFKLMNKETKLNKLINYSHIEAEIESFLKQNNFEKYIKI